MQDGNSPLLLALKPQEAGVGPSPFVIDWFLQAGADPNIVNKVVMPHEIDT